MKKQKPRMLGGAGLSAEQVQNHKKDKKMIAESPEPVNKKPCLSLLFGGEA